jgi:hypothetical protein
MPNDKDPGERTVPSQASNKEKAVEEHESVTHGRQSHVVNRRAEKDAHRDDADIDPVMPTGDATLKTKI